MWGQINGARTHTTSWADRWANRNSQFRFTAGLYINTRYSHKRTVCGTAISSSASQQKLHTSIIRIGQSLWRSYIFSLYDICITKFHSYELL